MAKLHAPGAVLRVVRQRTTGLRSELEDVRVIWCGGDMSVELGGDIGDVCGAHPLPVLTDRDHQAGSLLEGSVIRWRCGAGGEYCKACGEDE